MVRDPKRLLDQTTRLAPVSADDPRSQSSEGRARVVGD